MNQDSNEVMLTPGQARALAALADLYPEHSRFAVGAGNELGHVWIYHYPGGDLSADKAYLAAFYLDPYGKVAP